MTPRVLAIANRGEIAVRIAHTARREGWQPVALLGDPDLASRAAREVGLVERVGPAGSEIDVARVVAAARRAGAVALHPGYGFLSEKPELSAACEQHGIVFVGPSPATLDMCGDKIATREVASRHGVPVLPSSPPISLNEQAAWQAAAETVGYPLMVKIAGGGGGRGLRAALQPEELDGAIRSALREAGATGAGARLYLERYLVGARHVEVQVAGDGARAVALGDRDCSIQRRHQKVIEEAPAPGLSVGQRHALHEHAVTMAHAVGLRGVATVEFLIGSDGTIAFIEINPRLQVEHTVTEQVTGIDLVAVQLRLAFGGPLPDVVESHGHAIQARLYAEDPWRDFAPAPGPIHFLEWPRLPGLRIDAGYDAGDYVPSFYDPLIAKLIAVRSNRAAAIASLERALRDVRLAGTATNRPWLLAMLADTRFRDNTHRLSTAETVVVEPAAPSGTVLAAAVAQLRGTPETRSAWSLGPLRLVGDAVETFHGDEADGWQCSVRWLRAPDGWHPAPLNEQAVPASADTGVEACVPAGVSVVEIGEAIEISAPEGRWIARRGGRSRGGPSDRRRDGAVRAPMPGTVLSISVVPGQQVRRGDVLGVMVAMKIEITLAAPFDGTVVGVGAQPGALVGTHDVIVHVAPDGEAIEGGGHDAR